MSKELINSIEFFNNNDKSRSFIYIIIFIYINKLYCLFLYS